MKKRIKKEEETVIAGIDILPMINVSLILVIILMITSPMLNQPNIEVTLPEATTSETREKNVTVTYSADRQLGVNTEAVSFEELVPAVLKELGGDKNKLVVIRGDAKVPYGEIENIMDVLKTSVKAERIAIATRQKNEMK